MLKYAIAITFAFSALYAITFLVLAYFMLKLHQLIGGYTSIRTAVVDLAKSIPASEPRAWHVTYVAFIDHDQRNVGIPEQERLLFGKQFIFGSQTLDVRSDEQHVACPTMFKDMLYKSLSNDNVHQIEVLNAMPLRECDFQADTVYQENRAKFTFHDNTMVQGTN